MQFEQEVLVEGLDPQSSLLDDAHHRTAARTEGKVFDGGVSERRTPSRKGGCTAPTTRGGSVTYPRMFSKVSLGRTGHLPDPLGFRLRPARVRIRT